MEQIHFLPQWYMEKKKIKKIKILKIFIIIFFTIDLIFIDLLILNKNKINIIDNKIKDNMVLKKNSYDDKNKLDKKNCKTLDTFLIFAENICKNVNFKSLYIENKNIDIQLDLQSTDSMMLIKKIESTNKFNIRYIYVPYEDNENFKTKIGIELK